MTRKYFAIALLMLALVSGFVAGRVTAAQPHMNAALEHLRAARTSLEKAAPDKGGHREAALKLIGQAIREVEAGIGYAR